jgi:tetratricopeptide (TPR) repeat protein
MGEGLEERLFKARALAVLQAGPHAGAYANFAISQYKSWLVSAGESRGPVGARVAVSYGKLTFSHAKRLMRKGVPEGISPEEAKERGDLVRYLLRESLEALSSTAEAGGNLRGPNERMTVSEGPVDPVSLEAAIALMEIYVSIGDADKEESMRLFADELQTVAEGFDFESVALSYANLGAELRSRGEHERSTYYFKESFNLSLRTLGEKHRLTTATASAALGSLRRGALLGTTELSALGAFVRGVPEGVRLPIDRSTQGQGELSGPQREEVHGVMTDLFYEHIFVGRVLEALAEERSLSKAQRDEGRWLAELRGDPTAADLNAVAWASVDPNIESAGADVEHALRLARAAATLSPTDAGVRDTLAWALFANGEHEAAVAASERALELAGSDDAREYQGTLETLRAKVKEAQAATEER